MTHKTAGLIGFALLALSACGASSPASSPLKATTTTTTTTTSDSQGATTEVSTEHFRCVVYQPGGPNSGRLWCDHGSPGEGGAP